MTSTNSRSTSLISKQVDFSFNDLIQLGNRKQIQHAKNRRDLDPFTDDFLSRMIVDGNQIDRLRVQLISNFHTEHEANSAIEQIQTILDKYPKEMTSSMRKNLFDQTKIRFSAAENLQEFIDSLEKTLGQNSTIDPETWKFFVEQIHRLPENLSQTDQQRVNRLKKQLEDLRQPVEQLVKTPMEMSIDTMNQLIQCLRNFQEQIHKNAKQPNSDYEKSIVECRRIETDLEENFRSKVEKAINQGQQFYVDSTMENSAIADREETTIGSSFSKKRSDLTTRKVRRHVLQLGHHWKTVQFHVRQRLEFLERLETTIEDFRRKSEKVHAYLLEIELSLAHKSQIRSLSVEQIPNEIEESKNLLLTVMSYKTTIDDIQQSASTIENDFGISTLNRAQELEERWTRSVETVSHRVQSLQETIKNIPNDIYSSSVEPPWQRISSTNQRPYFINHADQTTSWDHPKMVDLFRSFSSLNDVRFAAYRTAMKLRALQKRLSLDLTSLEDVRAVLDEKPIDDPMNKFLDVPNILNFLHQIFDRTGQKFPQLVQVILSVDLTLNWLLNIYDVNRTGLVHFLAVKIALALLCRGNIEEKYRYIFSLIADPNFNQQVADRSRLAVLFQHFVVIPKQFGEVAAFGGSNVDPSIQSLFENSNDRERIDVDDYLQWLKLEPQSIVWLPVMHRLAASETAKHEARCNICKIYPILGFRYRSLRFFNFDICQSCFFSGKQTKLFKLDHPLQEYYTETNSSEDLRDFFRIFRNKFRPKSGQTTKLGYLPLPKVFESGTPPIHLIPKCPTPQKSDLKICQNPRTNDEHGLIVRHCRDLKNVKDEQLPSNKMSESQITLDAEQQEQLETIIQDLEEENRLLQIEYDRLCEQHFETSRSNNENYQIKLTENQIDLRRQAKQLRQYQNKLEQRMKILEEQNQQLEEKLQRSKENERFQNSSSLDFQNLSNSFHRTNQRDRSTIDNLFHMADDLNRAVGDLVSVFTEPSSSIST